MARLIDINHKLFGRGHDFIDFIETDEICRIAAHDQPPAGPAVAGYSAEFAITPPTYYSLSQGVADNRRINDTLLRIAAEWSGRAIAVAEPKYGEVAREEIRRVAGLGAAGIVWSPRAQGVFADDALMVDLCHFAADLGMVSLIHSTPYSINESLQRVWHLAMKCGNTPLVVLGAMASWENIQTIQSNHGGPANLYYDLSGLSAARDLQSMAAAIGARRLLFGSGGERHLPRILADFESCLLTVAESEAILWRNAAALLKL